MLTSGNDRATVSLLVAAVDSPSDLSVAASTGRLYIVSRGNRAISLVPVM